MSGRGRARLTSSQLQRKFLSLLDELPAVQVQNRLMACTDRDLALCLMGLDAGQVHALLDSVSARKAARVLAELALEERRRVEDRYRALSLQAVITSLAGERAAPGTRSYVRPHRRRRPDD